MALRLAFEWLPLFLLIGIGAYIMWVIKNEKKNYIRNARKIEFKKFKLFVPTWWAESPTNSENELCFKRLDTRYDWEAHFSWISVGDHGDLIELLKNYIHQRKIIFDKDTSIIYGPDYFQKAELTTSGLYEMARLEGTISEGKKRQYFDAFLLREKESGAFLYAESRGAVLNGLVEGSYFEEVMTRMELI